MARSQAVLAGVLAIAVLGTALALPASVSARPAYEIPVRYTPEAGSLEQVDGEAWSQVPSVGIPLSSSGAAVPGGDSASIEEIRIEVARTNERLYLRLSWADATRDVSVEEIRSFADALAIQLPVNETERPPLTMGGRDNLVNLWYWSGVGDTQELLAGGPGTTTKFPEPQVETTANYRDDRWAIVFSRPLESSAPNRTSISATEDVDIAVAVWNGSAMERSGAKAVSEWYYLALGPGPEGPPYETILWIVAGLAIVFTTLVTIEGVRRTRGE